MDSPMSYGIAVLIFGGLWCLCMVVLFATCMYESTRERPKPALLTALYYRFEKDPSDDLEPPC